MANQNWNIVPLLLFNLFGFSLVKMHVWRKSKMGYFQKCWTISLRDFYEYDFMTKLNIFIVFFPRRMIPLTIWWPLSFILGPLHLPTTAVVHSYYTSQRQVEHPHFRGAGNQEIFCIFYISMCNKYVQFALNLDWLLSTTSSLLLLQWFDTLNRHVLFIIIFPQ